MRTIEHILGYRPFSKDQLDLFVMAGIYNGIGTSRVNLDELIDRIFEATARIGIFDGKKIHQLREDLRQLICKHDISWRMKTGFYTSNITLARGVRKLLHWAPWYVRIPISFWVFGAVTFTKEARNTYSKK